MVDRDTQACLEQFALDALEAEDRALSALAEAATYRQLLSETLTLWRADHVRLRGATHRLRQVMGLDPWDGEVANESR